MPVVEWYPMNQEWPFENFHSDGKMKLLIDSGQYEE